MSVISILFFVVLVLAAIIFFQAKTQKKIKKSLEDEKKCAEQYRKQLAAAKEFQEKANKIDEEIEVKKNERKKMSKADKIASANNRS